LFDDTMIDSNEIRVLVESFEKTSRFTKITIHRSLNKKTKEEYIKIGEMLSGGSYRIILDVNEKITPYHIQQYIESESK